MKEKILSYLLVCFLFQQTVFYAFTPDEARNVFKQSVCSSKNSFFENGGYIFQVVKWSDEGDDLSEDREMRELQAQQEGLEKYLLPKVAIPWELPFCSALNSWFIPSNKVLNYSFSKIESCIVKDEEKQNEHTIVVAYDAEPLHREKSRIAAEYNAKIEALKTRTDAEWGKALAEVYEKHFPMSEDKRLFLFNLGCPIVSWLDPEISVGRDDLVKRGDKASSELLQLLDWTPSKGSVFEEHPKLTWGSQQKGGSGVFFPRWKGDDGGAFDDAVRLYKKGKDIPRIIGLLAKSISASPIGTEKWQYLGGVLNASGKYQDAVIAYMQSLRQDPSNSYSWKGLAKALEKAGYPENAKGVTWYLRMQGILK